MFLPKPLPAGRLRWYATAIESACRSRRARSISPLRNPCSRSVVRSGSRRLRRRCAAMPSSTWTTCCRPSTAAISTSCAKPEPGGKMIVVHHLNNSRSQRIVWLLEELGVPYQLECYQRDARTNLAPPELRTVHPLGKSPVIRDGDLLLSESGAIVEYLVERHGNGSLMPPRGTPEHVRYLHWMHFAEGTIMLHLLARLYLSRVGEPAKALQARVEGTIGDEL